MSKHIQSRGRLGAIAGTAIALAAAGTLLIAGPASAHVHVDGDAVAGARTTATFKVPTESDTASTTSITVTLPTDTPITSVRGLTKPGWEFVAERVDLDTPIVQGDVTITSAFGSITWTATGDGIAPGEYDEFVVQLGPVPDQPELVLPTEQGYSDGTTVAWDEVSSPEAEAEKPAPTLAIGSTETATPVDGLAVTGLILGGLGLIAGLVALIVVMRSTRRAG